MPIKYRFTIIAIGVLLALLWIQPAKADTFKATGSTIDSICGPLNCPDISLDLLITTNPVVYDTHYGDYPDPPWQTEYWVTGISGSVSDFGAVSTNPNLSPYQIGDLITTHLYTNFGQPIPDGWISITVDGHDAGLGGFDAIMIPNVDVSDVVMVYLSFPTPTAAFCSWTVTRAPEPSTVPLLGIGLLGLLKAVRGRRSSGRCV